MKNIFTKKIASILLGISLLVSPFISLAQSTVAIPPQPGHSGQFLTTDGLNMSWTPGIPGSGTVTSITAQNSITATPNPITNIGTINLVNDATSPGNSKYYGTNGAGTKGFFDLPSGGGNPAPPLHGVQYNNPLGTFDADAQFVRNSITGEFAVEGSIFTDPFETAGMYIDSNFLGGLVKGSYLLHNDPTSTVDAILFAGDLSAVDPSLSNAAIVRASNTVSGDDVAFIVTPTSGSLNITTGANSWNFNNTAVGSGFQYQGNSFIDLDPTTAINHIDLGSVGDPDIAIRSYVSLTAVQAQLDLLGYQSTPTTLNLYVGTAIPTPGTVTGSLNFIGSAITSLTSANNTTSWGYTACNTVTSGSGNTCIGRNANGTLTTGSNNVLVGFGSKVGNTSTGSVVVGQGAGSSSLIGDGVNTFTTIIGASSGLAATTGIRNTFVGSLSGSGVTTGSTNVLIGEGAGVAVTTDSDNVVIGASAGRNGASSYARATLVGRSAGAVNEADDSVLIGYQAGNILTTGVHNTAIGSGVMPNGTTGGDNVVMGYGAGSVLGAGSNDNVIIGSQAGGGVATLSIARNTYVGRSAGAVARGGDNTLVGYKTGEAMTTATDTTIVGSDSGLKITTGTDNVIIGSTAAQNITNANQNVIIGTDAMQAATLGSQNVIVGNDVATTAATVGLQNVFIGNGAASVTTSDDTVCVGAGACQELTDGLRNTAVGWNGGISLASGDDNVVMGYEAGRLVHANRNTALGVQALASTGLGYTVNDTVAIGYQAGNDATTGEENVFIGSGAGDTVTTSGDNVIIGFNAGPDLVNGSENNVFIGHGAGAGVSADVGDGGNIMIGKDAHSTQPVQNTICLGRGCEVSSTQYMVIGNQTYPVNYLYLGEGETVSGASLGANLRTASQSGTGQAQTFTLKVGDSKGTDQLGTNAFYYAGAGTGTGYSGTHHFLAAPATSTGSTVNTFIDIATIEQFGLTNLRNMITMGSQWGRYFEVDDTNHTFRPGNSVTGAEEGDNLVSFVNLSASRTVSLPQGNSAGMLDVWVKDEEGDAATWNIVVDADSTELIDGAANVTISCDFGAVHLRGTGKTAAGGASSWVVLSSYCP